jgi:hypothetical protein
MQVLNHNEGNFLIAHFQGNSYAGYFAISEHFKKQEIRVPENVTIVTVSNRDDKSMLIDQLKKNNIPFLNHSKKGGTWSNLKKIGYVNTSLKEVETDYVLILDAFDVLIAHPLDDIVNRFDEYGKKLLFNATKNNYPNLLIDMVADRDFRGEFRFLNAGCCFGKTQYAKEFYAKAKVLLDDETIENPKKSEQLIIRHAFKNATDDVDFDWKCDVFQTFGSTNVKFLEGEERYAID